MGNALFCPASVPAGNKRGEEGRTGLAAALEQARGRRRLLQLVSDDGDKVSACSCYAAAGDHGDYDWRFHDDRDNHDLHEQGDTTRGMSLYLARAASLAMTTSASSVPQLARSCALHGSDMPAPPPHLPPPLLRPLPLPCSESVALIGKRSRRSPYRDYDMVQPMGSGSMGEVSQVRRKPLPRPRTRSARHRARSSSSSSLAASSATLEATITRSARSCGSLLCVPSLQSPPPLLSLSLSSSSFSSSSANLAKSVNTQSSLIQPSGGSAATSSEGVKPPTLPQSAPMTTKTTTTAARPDQKKLGSCPLPLPLPLPAPLAETNATAETAQTSTMVSTASTMSPSYGSDCSSYASSCLLSLTHSASSAAQPFSAAGSASSSFSPLTLPCYDSPWPAAAAVITVSGPHHHSAYTSMSSPKTAMSPPLTPLLGVDENVAPKSMMLPALRPPPSASTNIAMKRTVSTTAAPAASSSSAAVPNVTYTTTSYKSQQLQSRHDSSWDGTMATQQQQQQQQQVDRVRSGLRGTFRSFVVSTNYDDAIDADAVVAVRDGLGNHQRHIYYALKTVRPSDNGVYMSDLRNEIDALARLDHPNIVRAIETYQHWKKSYLVLELCTGGDLYTRDPYTEVDARRIVSGVLSAVAYMHRKGLVHRDIKYENVMFVNDKTNSDVKIIDFGLSKSYFPGDAYLTTKAGTTYTMAPEIFRKKYTSKVDVWSVGVVAYMLLASRLPFYGNNKKKVMGRIVKGKFHTKGCRWKSSSAEARSFVSSLLNLDPNKRPTASEASRLPWLSSSSLITSDSIPNEEVTTEEPSYAPTTLPSVRPDKAEEEMKKKEEGDYNMELDYMAASSLRNYAGYCALKRLALLIIAHRLTSEEIGSYLPRLYRRLVPDDGKKEKREEEGKGKWWEEEDKEEMSPGAMAAPITVVGNFDEAARVILAECCRRVSPVDHLDGVKYLGMDYGISSMMTYTEFLSATIESTGSISTTRLTEAFDHLNFDGCGYITVENLRAILGHEVSNEYIEDIIEEADLANDKRISFDEFLTLW